MFDLFGNAIAGNTEPLGIPYMGSKRKYADQLICKMLEMRPYSKYFYDLFGGGGAMSFAAMQKGMTVFYNEKQTDMVALMRFIFERMNQPRGKFGLFPDEYYKFITREEFFRLKDESGVYAQFARICYSFGNYQRTYLFHKDLEKNKHLAHDAVVYQCQRSLDELNDALGVKLQMPEGEGWNERRLNLYLQIRRANKRFDLQQLERLQKLQQLEQLQQKITITNFDYSKVQIITPPEETIVYLDPPYRGTTEYIEGLNFDELDAYFENLPCVAFLSEYNAPFREVYSIETRSTLSASNNAAKRVERLFVNERAANATA